VTRGTFYEEPDDINTYRETFNLVQAAALAPNDSIAWIDRLARETA